MNLLREIINCFIHVGCLHKWSLYRGHYYVDAKGDRHTVVRCRRCGAMMTAQGILSPSEVAAVE